MPSKTNKIILITILLFAFCLRFWNINNLPSLNPDEAALGYNAYSLLKTGKDEHGLSWPLHFKSFGDFKPGGYVYLDLIPTFFLGLTPLATRLPNLILSLVGIFYLYKLVLLLTQKKPLALISALLLSISPWHIHFSRGAWESSTALAFIIFAVYYFFLFLQSNQLRHFYFFSLSAIASLYIYHSARLVTPLLVVSLVLINFKKVLPQIPRLILPLVFSILLTLPVFISFLQNGGTARIGGVGLTADYGPTARAEELLNQHGNVKLINRIIHNKRLLYSLSWAEKYASHFHLNFLFLNGDEVPRSKSPEMGQLYLLELPFLIIGLFSLIRSKIFSPDNKCFLLTWLFIAPIASSLTFQAPSALRSLPLVVPLIIIVSLGIYQTSIYVNHHFRWLKNITILLIILFYSYSLAYFLDAYFVHSPQRYPFAWNSKFTQIVSYLNSQKNNFQNIYFTNTYDQPYILYLYFSQYPPEQIQSQIKLTPPDNFGFSTVEKIDNLHFQSIPSDLSTLPPNSLVIDNSKNISQNDPIKIINFTNGQPAFKIYTTP